MLRKFKIRYQRIAEALGPLMNSVASYIPERRAWHNVNTLMELYRKVSRRAGMNEDGLRSALTELLLNLKVVEEKLGIKLGPKSLVQRKYENIVGNFLISDLERDDEEAKEMSWMKLMCFSKKD